VENPPDPESQRPGRVAGLALVFLLSFQAGAVETADQPVYRIGPAADWVESIGPDFKAATPAGDAERSTHHILLDYQADARERGQSKYYHYAVRLVNDAGAEEYSQLTFYADPAYETLTLHALRVYRDGQVSDRLESARITVLPVESDLQERIYSGEQSVNLLVSDLRAGDVLEYAYTSDSMSPNFPEHFAAKYSIAWSVPVHHQRIRVRHLPGDPVNYRVHGGRAEPVVGMRGGKREIVFDWRDQPARAGESDTPDWHPHWAYVEFSDMPDWNHVAAPTAAMYRQAAAGPRARALAGELRSMSGTDADRVLRALRMVQDEIRYASISIGPGSYRPHAPDLVLERNFGDCKDKSLLLATVLRDIGIDARVALVNTRTGRTLPAALPTPYAFDHAIVRAQVDKRVLWLDPTATQQRGTLDRTTQADFVNALVIDPATMEIEPIPRNAPEAWTRDVVLSFDLRAGFDKPAKLLVNSRYAGRAADSIRLDIASRNAAERSTDYLNFYAGYYPGIQADGPLTVEDDPVGNVVVLRERYRLERAFRPRDDDELVFEIFPDELFGYAEGTDTPIRTSPIEQPYPAKVSQRFEVKLPEHWPVRNTRVAINNPAFRYESTVRYADRALNLEYRFESLSDEVAVSEIPRYLADKQRMSDDLGYELSYDEPGGRIAAGIAPYPLAAAVLGLLAGLALAFRVTLGYDPSPRSPRNPESAPAGIRGWLLLVALNVVINIGMLLAVIYALTAFSAVEVWSGLPAIADEGIASAAHHLVAALQFIAFAFLPSAVVVTILFFQRRSSAPRLVTATFWALSLFGVLADQLTSRLVPMEEGDTATTVAGYLGDLLFLLIWTRYLHVSERVAATFVRRRTTSGGAAVLYEPQLPVVAQAVELPEIGEPAAVIPPAKGS
jgi:hypothetical protein